jgi:hypothetical protein
MPSINTKVNLNYSPKGNRNWNPKKEDIVEGAVIKTSLTAHALTIEIPEFEKNEVLGFRFSDRGPMHRVSKNTLKATHEIPLTNPQKEENAAAIKILTKRLESKKIGKEQKEEIQNQIEVLSKDTWTKSFYLNANKIHYLIPPAKTTAKKSSKKQSKKND